MHKNLCKRNGKGVGGMKWVWEIWSGRGRYGVGVGGMERVWEVCSGCGRFGQCVAGKESKRPNLSGQGVFWHLQGVFWQSSPQMKGNQNHFPLISCNFLS